MFNDVGSSQQTKIVGQWDFFNWDGVADEEPGCGGHGTHVAGIAAGELINNGGIDYVGVAPGARIFFPRYFMTLVEQLVAQVSLMA
jgi:subtilisin family serine protease